MANQIESVCTSQVLGVRKQINEHKVHLDAILADVKEFDKEIEDIFTRIDYLERQIVSLRARKNEALDSAQEISARINTLEEIIVAINRVRWEARGYI